MDIPGISSLDDIFSLANNISKVPTVLLITFIISIIAAIIVFAVFLPKEKKYNYRGFAKTIYNYLNFNTFCISPLVKFLYMTVTLTLILSGIVIIFMVPLLGLALLIIGVIIRKSFEKSFLMYMIYERLTQIRNKMDPNDPVTDPIIPQPRKAFCPQCGKEKSSGEVYCENCGYKY